MKYVYFLLFAVLTLVSCSSDEIAPEGTNTNIPQGTAGYRFSVNVGEPTTRVTYHDNIGGKDSPYNPNSDGSNKVTMSWRNGDELVAIRWSGDFDEYVVLQAEVAEGQDVHNITFDAEDVAHFKTPLKDGERFVLVHGDFVLDASNTADPKLAFPTSQVTKAGYGKNIHHGGVVESDGAITFRNQDGTLENLRKHEYMVADCKVKLGSQDDKSNVQASFVNSEDGSSIVKMHIAHTLLRLTLFLPDEDFNNGDEDDLIAVSLKDVGAHPIFHRYFRMHPNEKGTTNYWKTSYNDNADHEENAYVRINLVDETTGKHGFSHRAINVFGSDGFNPKKPVVVAGELGGKSGHYFTLYFSLPSRHMGLGDYGDPACSLKVTAFTRTHAYTTTKTYGLPDDAMQPGQVVPLNVSFVGNSTKLKAITDPELGFSFTPGFVYANKVGNNWELGVYENQGQYAGMINQTLDFGEYFTFGSTDPTQAGHKEGNKGVAAVVPSPFVDVAAEVEVDGVKGLYHMLTKAEADRIMKRLQDEVKENGVFLGYYYYDAGKLSNTAHQAPGSQQTSILEAAAGGTKTKEELMAMSASVGIYVGRSTQPKFEEQDDYFFLPSAAQMHYDSTGSGVSFVETGGKDSGIGYYLPGEYKHLNATGTGLTSAFTETFKFSTWLRDANNTGYRMQVWTTNAGKALNTDRTNADTSDKKTYARPIRAVIY